MVWIVVIVLILLFVPTRAIVSMISGAIVVALWLAAVFLLLALASYLSHPG